MLSSLGRSLDSSTRESLFAITIMEKRPRPGEDPQEETKLEIGRNRFVEVSKFKGKTYVNIREFYEDESGDLKPGRKGIALKLNEWAQLCEHKEKIDQLVAEQERK